MCSGFLDFHSPLVSLLLCSNKLPGSQMSLSISLFGSSPLRSLILRLCRQPKKELTLVVFSWKELNGMEIKIALPSLNL